MFLELFPFVILNNAIAYLYAYFFSDFLRFNTSLLLVTVTQQGYLISIAYCLFFHFFRIFIQSPHTHTSFIMTIYYHCILFAYSLMAKVFVIANLFLN